MNLVEPIKKVHNIELIKEYLKGNERNLLMFNLGINSGLRKSDILTLDVKDVKDKEYIAIREKKTNKFKRFPLNKNLQEQINKFMKDKELDSPLFLTQKHKRLDRIQAYKILNKAVKTLGFDIRVGTHSLRKTFGYHHFKKFNNLPLLQKNLNHSSPSVTLRYTGIEQDTIDESYMNFYL